ncbi:MAG: hypothetical protein N2V78_09095 [Methanophagales archaeon]|nr:hypothetical protein [Methanophagales archaeon]
MFGRKIIKEEEYEELQRLRIEKAEKFKALEEEFKRRHDGIISRNMARYEQYCLEPLKEEMEKLKRKLREKADLITKLYVDIDKLQEILRKQIK